MNSPSPSLDPRARQLLRTLISRYIRDGEPVAWPQTHIPAGHAHDGQAGDEQEGDQDA